MYKRQYDNHYDQSRHEDNYPHDGNYRIAEPNTEDHTETVQNQHSNQNENREEGVSPHLN